MEDLGGIERILVYTLIKKRGLFLIGQRVHLERKKLSPFEKSKGVTAEETKIKQDYYEFPRVHVDVSTPEAKKDYPAVLAREMRALLGIRIKPISLVGETVNKTLLVKWLLCNQASESEHPVSGRDVERYVYVPGEELYITYKFRPSSGSRGFMIPSVAEECNIRAFLDGQLPYRS